MKRALAIPFGGQAQHLPNARGGSGALTGLPAPRLLAVFSTGVFTMDGVRLFLHALRMVLGNFQAAMRIGGILFLVQLALAFLSGTSYLHSAVGNVSAPDAPQQGLTFILSLAQVIFWLWVAVAWHRFILLEENPGTALPAWHGGAIWSYFLSGLLVALIAVIVAIPTVFVGTFLLFPFLSSNPGNPLMYLLALLVFYLPSAYVGYRLSPVLPGTAIGRKLPLKEAWYATGISGGALWVLAVVSLFAGWLALLPALLLLSVSTTLALVWGAGAQWLTIMVGASILTTLYGHYVEKRDLNA
jgi:hypothetical protein